MSDLIWHAGCEDWVPPSYADAEIPPIPSAALDDERARDVLEEAGMVPHEPLVAVDRAELRAQVSAACRRAGDAEVTE